MRYLQMQIAGYAYNRPTETYSCCNYTHKLYECMNRHVMKIRVLVTLFIFTIFKTREMLLILLCIMKLGLWTSVISFRTVKWEVLEIRSILFVCGRLIYFSNSCLWMILKAYKFLHDSYLWNLVSQGWWTCVYVGCSSPVPKRKNSVKIRWSYSFSASKTFT